MAKRKRTIVNISGTKNSQSQNQGSTSQPRRRGYTRMSELCDLNEGEHVVINLNELGQPIGVEATNLSNYIGSTVRQFDNAPIDYDSWHHVPSSFKEKKIAELEHLSETNKKNRAKYDDPYCTGSKSFARVIDEKTKKNNGVRPSRAKLYIETRTKKDGSYVNDKTAEIYELMKEGMQEMGGSESTEGQRYWNDDVYSHVKRPEKRGRIHRVGKAPSCSKDTSSTSVEQEGESTHLRNMVQHLGSEVSGLKGLVASLIAVFQSQAQVNPQMAELIELAQRHIRSEASDAGSTPSQTPHENRDGYSHHDQNGLLGMQKLRVLDLGHHQLIGWIPTALENLTSLNYLYLYQNNLTGLVPSQGLEAFQQQIARQSALVQIMVILLFRLFFWMETILLEHCRAFYQNDSNYEYWMSVITNYRA
ncbi:uncharacterized protein [Elaeis guineensis]|uniref:uncharacterized protein n=1 Tax=Elaeis guineensis var. tenera TaxID=51953 RepID=UPI003C6D8B4C